MLLCERPAFSQPVIMLARKNHVYERPITGDIVDIRIEDFIPNSALTDLRLTGIIGKLPPVKEQTNNYFVAIHNSIDKTDYTYEEILPLIKSGRYLILPDSPQSPLWEYSKSPWWEYAVVIDQYGGFIKAPKVPRSGEPTPDEIDETLDNYDENRDTIKVISPSVIDRWRKQNKRENIQQQLQRFI